MRSLGKNPSECPRWDTRANAGGTGRVRLVGPDGSNCWIKQNHKRMHALSLRWNMRASAGVPSSRGSAVPSAFAFMACERLASEVI